MEMNELEIFIVKADDRLLFLKNKDTVVDLVDRGLWDYEKLKPGHFCSEIFSYWNGGKLLE